MGVPTSPWSNIPPPMAKAKLGGTPFVSDVVSISGRARRRLSGSTNSGTCPWPVEGCAPTVETCIEGVVPRALEAHRRRLDHGVGVTIRMCSRLTPSFITLMGHVERPCACPQARERSAQTRLLEDPNEHGGFLGKIATPPPNPCPAASGCGGGSGHRRRLAGGRFSGTRSWRCVSRGSAPRRS